VASVWSLAYDLYERRLLRNLPPDKIPAHIGVMCDGNRRWARAWGGEVEGGYLAGAGKIEEFLGWCDQLGVKLVTLWLLSTDNLGRPADETGPLLQVIEDLVDQLATTGKWRIHPVGALDLLPGPTARRLKHAAESTALVDGMDVNIAIAYGGRRAHRRAPLHQGSTRSRPGHPHLRGTTHVGVPAVAERPQRVLLLRGAVAGLPAYRLPAGDP
jgi:short-chain Z-isoprenyl diphosphate synthase